MLLSRVHVVAGEMGTDAPTAASCGATVGDWGAVCVHTCSALKWETSENFLG